MTDMLTELLVAGVALALPIVIASSAEVVSERAGVLNMSIESMMLTGCFTSVLVAASTGSALAGLFAGAVGGLVVAALQALLSVRLQADQIVTGLALNTLAIAGTTFAARLLLSRDTTAPGFERLRIPGLVEIPVIGPALFALPWITYPLAIVLIAMAYLTSRRTSWGLAIDACGEDAIKADWAGVRVQALRTFTILYVGVASGVAGTYLALAQNQTFTDHMTAGIGYLAVVAVIAARWRTGLVAIVALVFGLAQALQFALPVLGVNLNPALLVMLPYVLALIAVAGLVSRSHGPSALTIPFVRPGR